MFSLKINDETILIYEYADAEDLIRRLSDIYRDDLTAISSGGKNRNRKLYYNYCCSFDIETSTINSGYYGYFHKEGRPLGVPYLFQFNISFFGDAKPISIFTRKSGALLFSLYILAQKFRFL